MQRADNTGYTQDMGMGVVTRIEERMRAKSGRKKREGGDSL